MSSSTIASGNSEPVGDLVSPELAEELIADSQLLFGEIVGVLNRTRLSSLLERIESARGFVKDLTVDIRALRRIGGALVAGPCRGDEERVDLGMSNPTFLERVQIESLERLLMEPSEMYMFGRVKLDLLRRYVRVPTLIPIGGGFTLEEKRTWIRIWVDKPLTGFVNKLFKVKIGDDVQVVFGSKVGSLGEKNPSLLELVVPLDPSGLNKHRVVTIFSQNHCAVCAHESRPDLGISLDRCAKCISVFYCSKACQIVDFGRDHGKRRTDGVARSAFVPKKGWCDFYCRSADVFPKLDYDTYMSGESSS